MSNLKSALIASMATLSALALAPGAIAAPPEPGGPGSQERATAPKTEAPMMKEGPAAKEAPMKEKGATTENKLDTTKAALRDLLVEHIFWMRNVVTSQIGGVSGEQKEAEKQVVANAHAIASAIEPYYGPKASEKLFELLSGHYGDFKAYLEATIAGNTTKQQEAAAKLNHEPDEIGSFFSGANPNLPKATVSELWQLHVKDHMDQIQQLHAKDYPAEADTWRYMTHHVYVLADALGDGLYKQFPAQF